MVIREAVLTDLQEAMAFYDFMCQELAKASFMPNGNKGGFPSLEMVKAAIENGQLYIGQEDGQIMAAYILSHDADPVYGQVTWQVEAAVEEVSVLHALRVHPQYSGRGYASRLLEHSIQTAREKHQRALRLDCLEDNPVPRKMYLSHGFACTGTVEIFYQDIGEPRKCLLFELVIG